MAKILVVVLHRDHVVLGFSDAIVHHADSGDQLQELIIAEDSISCQQQRDRDQAGNKHPALAQAAQPARVFLGNQGVKLLDLLESRTNSLDRLTLLNQIVDHFTRHQVQVVYVHQAGDVNVDYHCLHEAVATASRPMPDQLVWRLLSFAAASRTALHRPSSAPPFQPTCFFDISAHWSRKRETLVHLVHWSGAKICLDNVGAFIRCGS